MREVPGTESDDGVAGMFVGPARPVRQASSGAEKPALQPLPAIRSSAGWRIAAPFILDAGATVNLR